MGRFLSGEYYNEIDYCNFYIIEIKTGLWRGYYGKYKFDERGNHIPKKLPKGYIHLPKDDFGDYRDTRIRQNGKIVKEKVNQRILKQVLKQNRSLGYSRDKYNRRERATDRRIGEDRRNLKKEQP